MINIIKNDLFSFSQLNFYNKSAHILKKYI